MMTHEEILMYEQMVENEIVTAKELNLARMLVDGSWSEVIERVLYIRTGYRTLEQFFDAEDEE